MKGLVLVQLGGILAGGFLVRAADLVTPRRSASTADPPAGDGPGAL